MNEQIGGVKQPTELARKEDTSFYSPLRLVFTESLSTTKNICVMSDLPVKSFHLTPYFKCGLPCKMT